MSFRFTVLLVLLSVVPARASSEDPIRWADPAHTEPLFLPESALQRSEPDPRVAVQTFWKVRGQIAEKAKAFEKSGHCAVPVQGDTVAVGTSPERWPSPSQKMETGLPAFIGTVTETIAGWSIPARYPVSLVKIRVDEVLSDPAGRLQKDDYLFFEQDAGVLAVGASRLCTHHPRYPRVKPGDRALLIVGSFDEVNPGFVYTTPQNLYPIRDGKAYVQGPWPSDKPESFSLDAIRKERRHKEGQR